MTQAAATRKIPFRGGLLDLFGAQVIHSDPAVAGDSWPSRSIQIPMIPTEQELPRFRFRGTATDHRRVPGEVVELPSRKSWRGPQNAISTLRNSHFALRERARSLAAATPDDLELQAEVFNLLREEDAEIRADKLIDPSAIAGEAVLVAWYGSPGGIAYVADLAATAEVMLRGRGEQSTIDPAVFGKQLRLLGFATERDAKGKKLHLTEAVRDRAQQLVHDFGGPEGSDGPKPSGNGELTKASGVYGCRQCRTKSYRDDRGDVFGQLGSRIRAR